MFVVMNDKRQVLAGDEWLPYDATEGKASKFATESDAPDLGDVCQVLDLHVVAYDIPLENLTIAPEDKPYVKRVYQVFLFDRTRHVHCCELTPSYELTYLYSDVVTDQGDMGDDEWEYKRQQLWEDYAVSIEQDDCEYRHVRAVDKLIGNPARHKHYGEAIVESGETYESTLEWHRERLCGNPPL